MSEFPRAPDFPASLEWINCDPMILSRMRGRVVALAFWHTAAVTSVNLLVDLQQLLMRYADGLSVIGVHVPKFDAQRNPDLVSSTVDLFGLRFPVAQDADAITWQHYGIRAWPSVALIDCEGRLIEIIAGDRQREAIERRIVSLLDEAGERGQRVYEIAAPASRPGPLGEVVFPHGLALGPERLYVSDSGHHRILECTLDGRILRAFGSGTATFADGLGVQAGFQFPMGMVLHKNQLYVADAGNHAVRRIHLDTGKVDTLIARNRGDLMQVTPLVQVAAEIMDRPFDLALDADRLYIAMAGAHQIWQMDLSNRSFTLLAGSGYPGMTDGPATSATFFQPSNLALGGNLLYVCDSQSSALRCLDLNSGDVRTVLGQEFQDPTFGDIPSFTQLQFPTGIALNPKTSVLWVADCYNDAIGLVHLDCGEMVHVPLSHPLKRPMALISDGQSLWISNTDAHEVLCLNLSTHELQVLPMTA